MCRGQEKAKTPQTKIKHKLIKAIEERIIADIKNPFEQEEDDYKPVRGGNF